MNMFRFNQYTLAIVVIVITLVAFTLEFFIWSQFQYTEELLRNFLEGQATTPYQKAVSYIPFILTLISSIAVYIDARKLKIENYKPLTFFGQSPLTFALFTLFTGPTFGGIIYMWYRQQFLDGKVSLK